MVHLIETTDDAVNLANPGHGLRQRCILGQHGLQLDVRLVQTGDKLRAEARQDKEAENKYHRKIISEDVNLNH